MRVGYRLYREIRDFAPQDWTPGELVVALMIADDAKDATRVSWIPNAELCYRTRLKAAAVRKHLASLAARGFEFRVIHGRDKNGDPVFAAKGHRVDYLVPDMFKGATDVAAMAAGARPKGATIRPEGATDVAALSRKGATDVAPLPSEDLNPTQNPSVDCAVVTTSVEGTREPPGHEHDPDDSEFRRQANGLTRWQQAARGMSPIEAAAWNAIHPDGKQ